MPVPEPNEILSEPSPSYPTSDRHGWLIATGIVVAVIIAAGVFLATRTSDDGMPGMDMGSEVPTGDLDTPPTTVGVPLGPPMEEHGLPARLEMSPR